MQSPTIIAGLRRIATSLWLHFVASPQRVPVFGHRRRGRPVVNVIYKVPPPSSNTRTSARSRSHELRRASGCETYVQQNRIAPPASCPRAPIYRSRYLRSQITPNQEVFQASESLLEPALRRHTARGGSNQWPSPERACDGEDGADGARYRSSS
jgi:hypothetical protein